MRWIREETACNAKQDLRADDARFPRATGRSAVVDQQTKRDKEEDGAGDDEDLEAPNAVDDRAEREADEDGAETVQAEDTGGTEDGEVEGHDENGVEIVALA